jgi:uncharacterized membrane protein YfbV (UPF0208 family)
MNVCVYKQAVSYEKIWIYKDKLSWDIFGCNRCIKITTWFFHAERTGDLLSQVLITIDMICLYVHSILHLVIFSFFYLLLCFLLICIVW